MAWRSAAARVLTAITCLAMGLFDRLRGSKPATPAADKAGKADETFFLDADSSSSLGDLNLMRRTYSIRRTFPGSADSPGNKEMVQAVSSMETKMEKLTEGMPGSETANQEVSLTGGVPKPVKKTFAMRMSEAELSQRLKGAAVGGVNEVAGPASAKKASEAAASQPQITSQQPNKPGSIEGFKSMVRELNS